MVPQHHLSKLVLDGLLHGNHSSESLDTSKKLLDLKEEMNIKRGGVNSYHEL